MSIFFLQNKMKWNLSCSISTKFIPELMQENTANVFEKFRNSILNSNSKQFMNFKIPLEISIWNLETSISMLANIGKNCPYAALTVEVVHISKYCFNLSREDANHLKTKTQCQIVQIKCANKQVNKA